MADFFSLLTKGRLLQLQMSWRPKRHLQYLDNVFGDILWHSRAQERDFRPGTDTMKASEKRILFDGWQSSYMSHLKTLSHRGKYSFCLYSCEENVKVFQSCNRDEKYEIVDAAKNAVVRTPAVWGH